MARPNSIRKNATWVSTTTPHRDAKPRLTAASIVTTNRPEYLAELLTSMAPVIRQEGKKFSLLHSHLDTVHALVRRLDRPMLQKQQCELVTPAIDFQIYRLRVHELLANGAAKQTGRAYLLHSHPKGCASIIRRLIDVRLPDEKAFSNIKVGVGDSRMQRRHGNGSVGMIPWSSECPDVSTCLDQILYELAVPYRGCS